MVLQGFSHIIHLATAHPCSPQCPLHAYSHLRTLRDQHVSEIHYEGLALLLESSVATERFLC